MTSYFLRILALSGIVLAGALAAVAPTAARAQSTVEAGMFILRINNVSPREGVFDIDAWMWFRWTDPALAPHQTFEFSNGVINSRTEPTLEQDGEMMYSTLRVQATLFHEYNVKRFPLDDHILPIHLEDAVYNASQQVYAVAPGIALDPDVSVAGWAVSLAPASTETHVYPTNYGLESAGPAASQYSRLTIPVALDRTSVAPLFKQFWISTLAVILGLLALLVKADDLDARYGLGLGSIFAASANSFVIAEALPETTFITLAEQINLVAVCTIFLTLFVSVWSLRYRYVDKEEESLRLDRISLIAITAFYLLANAAVLAWEYG